MSYQLEAGETTRVAIIHELSLEEIANLRREFWEQLKAGSKTLVVDFAKTPALDPSTLSLLVSTKNLAAKFKADLQLINLNQDCLNFLDSLNMVDYFGQEPIQVE